MTSRSETEGSVRRELAQNDFEWPPRAPIGGDDPHDRPTRDAAHGSKPTARNASARPPVDVEAAESDERMQIVWLPVDESALDAFPSESALLDVPAPSPYAAGHPPATVSATEPIREPAVTSATAPTSEDVRRSSVRRPRTDPLERSFDAPARTANDGEAAEPDERLRIEWLPRDGSALDAFPSESALLDVPAPSPGATRPPAIASATDPIQHPAIASAREPIREPAVTSATPPIREGVRRSSVGRQRNAVVRRFSFAALTIGVICGSMAGLYVRRHAASPAATPFAVHHETNVVATAAAPASEIVSPAEYSQTPTAAVIDQSVPSGDNLAVPRGIELREAPPPGATTISNAPPASPRQENSALALPRSANQNLPPPLAVVSPAETPSTRLDPVVSSGIETSSREKSDGSDVPSTPQSMPVAARAPLEAVEVPSTTANPVTPLAATSFTTARERAAETTPAAVAIADERPIAAVLKRFTDAYTQLSVPAAKAVWPSVDGRALARAFDALASQSIAFDNCTVQVSGAEARAACVGELTYVPKIGRRSARAVNQHWNFVMKKNPDGWTITDAQMR